MALITQLREAAIADLEASHTFWNKIRNRNDPVDFDASGLRHYPNIALADLPAFWLDSIGHSSQWRTNEYQELSWRFRVTVCARSLDHDLLEAVWESSVTAWMDESSQLRTLTGIAPSQFTSIRTKSDKLAAGNPIAIADWSFTCNAIWNPT